MNIKINTKNTKDTFYTLVPLNWLLRLFNLSCIYRKEYQLEVSWSLIKTIIYVFIFGFVNFFFLLTKIERLDIVKNKTSLITFSDTIQITFLMGYFEYIIDLIYVYRYGRQLFLKYFKCFDHIDKILGMPYYDEIRTIILKTVGFSMITWILTSIIDYCSFVGGFGWVAPTLYSLDYFYFFLNSLTVLDGMTHVIQLEYRLKRIKDLLQGYYSSPNSIKSIHVDDNKTWALIIDSKPTRLESSETVRPRQFIEEIEFNRCYILLLQQTNYINSKFGLRQLVLCVNLLLNMINLLNIAIRFYTGLMVTPNGVCRLPSISSIIRLLNWAIIAFIQVYRCESTYKQSDEILENIDLLLIEKNISANLTKTLIDFRNLLTTRPIKFHALRFFTIEYPLLVSVASVVVTYTIILLQSIK